MNKVNSKYMPNSRFSFRSGFAQVRRKDAAAVKRDIMEVFGIKSRTSWYLRMNGNYEPKVSEVDAVNEIFRRYGVRSNIWGR